MAMSFDPKKVPPERWAGALAMVLLQHLTPNALLDLVRDGEDAFVKLNKKHDQLGLSDENYRDCFRKLRRKATEMGLDPRLLKNG